MARSVTIYIEDNASSYFFSHEQGWTLSFGKVSKPEPIEEYTTVPGRTTGALDMSTALTDGEVLYNNRTLEIVLENSNGTRAERYAKYRALVSAYAGKKCRVTLPDYPDYFVTGRLKFSLETHDLAHTIVRITATVEPWFYSVGGASIPYQVSQSAFTTRNYNNEGDMTLRPYSVEVVQPGGSGTVTIAAVDDSWTYTLGVGSYIIPELVAPPGDNAIFKHKGALAVKLHFKYAKAILE